MRPISTLVPRVLTRQAWNELRIRVTKELDNIYLHAIRQPDVANHSLTDLSRSQLVIFGSAAQLNMGPGLLAFSYGSFRSSGSLVHLCQHRGLKSSFLVHTYAVCSRDYNAHRAQRREMVEIKRFTPPKQVPYPTNKISVDFWLGSNEPSLDQGTGFALRTQFVVRSRLTGM